MSEESSRHYEKLSLVQRVLVLLLVVFVFWLYYPALSLPLSLIDDLVLLNNLDRFVSDYQQGGIVAAIKNDISMVIKTYNPGYYLLAAFNFRLSGGHPFHWLKLAQMTVTALLLFGALRAALPHKKLAGYAGLFSVFLFLVSDVPGAVDFHGLRINWYRLFNTDADGVFFLALHTYCFFRMVQSPRTPHRWVWGAGAVGAGFLATTIKLPYIALVLAPLCSVGAAAVLTRDKRIAVQAFAVAVVTSIIFVGFYLLMRSLSAPASSPDNAYGERFSLDPAEIWAGLSYYLRKFADTFGPLSIGCLSLCLVAFISFARSPEHQRLPLFSLVYFAAFASIGVVMYSPWAYKLPRYMLPAFLSFSALAGISLYFVLSVLQTTGIRMVVIIGAATLGVAATLFPPLLLCALILAAIAVYIVKRETAAIVFIAGVSLAGLLYVLFSAPLQRSAINHYYVAREFANWQATLQTLKQSAQGKPVYFAGDVADEHIGSMTGYISRFGITPVVKSAAEVDQATSPAVVLVHRQLSPPEDVEKWSNYPVLANYNVPKSPFQVPVSFWEFRRRLFSRESDQELTQDTWHSDFVWRYHEVTKQESPIAPQAPVPNEDRT